MATAIEILKAAFDKLKGAATSPFLDGQNVSRYDLEGKSIDSVKGSTFKKASTFAFIPAYNLDTSVDFYIRLGGGEAIQKLETEIEFYETELVGDLKDSRKYYNPESSSVTTPANAFTKKYDTIADGDDDMNFDPHLAPERLFVQRAVLNVDNWWGQYMPLVRKCYPLRLKADLSKGAFVLQYAPIGEEYANISDAIILADFEKELIVSLLLLISEKEMLTVLQGLKKSETQIALVQYVMGVFETDFKEAILTHALTYDDDAATADNDYDTVFFAAFAQFTNPFSKKVGEIVKIAKDTISKIKDQIVVANLTGAEAAVTKFVNLLGLDAEGADAALKAKVGEQDAEISKLKSQLSADVSRTQAEQDSRRSRERIIGGVSSAAVTLWAMQDEELKKLDMLQKGILVAVGGALGAFMPSGYSPLAVLAAPVTTTFLAKQLVAHEITATRAQSKYRELSNRVGTRLSGSEGVPQRANPKRRKKSKKRASR